MKKEVNDFVGFLLNKSKLIASKPAKFGSTKGKTRMSADFDEPLDTHALLWFINGDSQLSTGVDSYFWYDLCALFRHTKD